VEIYQIRVFLEVARHLSFTEAANALNLTQPAVSSKIKSLESELGTPLFHRLGRRVELTAAGNYLVEFGPSLIEKEQDLIAGITKIKQGKWGELRVASTPEISSYWLPDFLFKYHQSYPDIKTYLSQLDTAEQLYRSLIEGEADIGISEIGFDDFDELESIQVDRLFYRVILAQDHPLAEAEFLSLKDLQQWPWVLQPEGSPLRLAFESRLAELGLSLKDFAQIQVAETASLMQVYLKQGGCLGFTTNLEFPVECQTKVLTQKTILELALPTKLFLVRPRRLAKAQQCSQASRSFKYSDPEPAQKFMDLIFATKHQVGKQKQSPEPTRGIASSPLPIIYLHPPCFQIRSPVTAKSEKVRLSIGIQNQTLQTMTAGLIIRRLGLLEHFLPRKSASHHLQYEIQWHDFNSGAPIVEGLKTQKLDIGILGDYPLLLTALNNQRVGTEQQTCLVSFIACNPDGGGNDIIVPLHSNLNQLADLRGKSIAVPFDSAAHGMVMRSLSREDLLKEVTLVDLPHLNRWRVASPSIQVDGYAYFAPFHAIAEHYGKFRRLSDVPLNNLPTFHGVVVRRSLMEQYPEMITAYLQALLAAQYWYATSPSAPSLVSQWVGLDTEIVLRTLCQTIQWSIGGRSEPGLFYMDNQIRPDWFQEHIQQLTQISGNESFQTIQLDNWIQGEFLERAMQTL
jgi:NitT/TauT family transport system substrate-binding protein